MGLEYHPDFLAASQEDGLPAALHRWTELWDKEKGPRAFRGPVPAVCRLHSAYAY